MKPSHIDWCPMIPDHWEEKRIKDIAFLQSGNSITAMDFVEDGKFPVYGGNGLRGYTNTYTNEGDYVLIGRQGALCGNINYAHGKFYASEHAVVVYPKKEEITLWLGETLRTANLNRLSMTAAQPGLAVSTLNLQFIPFPPKDERIRIAKYLDKKLSEIDHQVSLLTSKRDAYLRLKKSIINHAVTRGLNPNVKMKDSGIEWIGEVPEHWEMCRFKDAFRRWTTGITPDSKNYKYFESDICKGYTWVTISDFLEKYISKSNLNLSDESIKLFMPPLSLKGSLMFSFKLSVGKIAFADKDLYTNEAIVSIPPNNGQCLEYYYYMLPNVLHENATENIYGAKMLNQKIIANMLMIVPPLPEQRAIATYLDDKCAKIDTIVSNLDKQISRYADLKRSLIDEVITGKRAV
ncbi:restriction endonuclease subunit S [uncultured Prevotella sp.]|uniref:restriction endonuclease subunit S n=1 Tax=uncultured Prevotella sp. TaxID=159272 RepID=UPI0027E28A90|nr:restriction endonuclease subunit S [uncultured Prevotella sp.]